ncbi:MULTISPECIES: ABC transporter ATP-binding protein [Arthrobacter]|uniref:ABC transporter ATP-binding protein n=2 Tax=Arthrobacter TaxID=1663 RepID=A0ABU9KNX1_9MICC|nr:ABC transporter ATP-binding protein [Arthrobacter sp. YJM1]MDP5228201.1 ABC transporter ATP-binding protein [Arthrobacter sp. YJM1]
MTTAPALELHSVTVDYPDGSGTITALDQVSLTVNRGEFLALTGPSGSGKSTLLSVAATLVAPTAGRVLVDGREVQGLGRSGQAELRREKLGIIFQQPNLLPSLTAVEQLLVTQHVRGFGSRKQRATAVERARTLLAAVGLEGQENKRPHQLSGGQRQRVNIARALMGQPSVLLVDEPTAALDAERSHAVVELLARITRDFGTATVMVTHDLEFVDLCDREVHMRDGKLSESVAA